MVLHGSETEEEKEGDPRNIEAGMRRAKRMVAKEKGEPKEKAKPKAKARAKAKDSRLHCPWPR